MSSKEHTIFFNFFFGFDGPVGGVSLFLYLTLWVWGPPRVERAFASGWSGWGVHPKATPKGP